MGIVCYVCYHVHDVSSRVTCTDCKACAGKPTGVCLRKRCPRCNAGTYFNKATRQEGAE